MHAAVVSVLSIVTPAANNLSCYLVFETLLSTCLSVCVSFCLSWLYVYVFV